MLLIRISPITINTAKHLFTITIFVDLIAITNYFALVIKLVVVITSGC